MRLFSYFLMFTLFYSCSRDSVSLDNKPSEENPYGIIYSSNQWKMTAFDIAQEKVLWQTDLTGVLDANTALYDNGTIYTNTKSGVVALDATNGHIKWRHNGGGISPAGGKPVVVDTLLYSIGNNQPMWGLGSSIYCLNTRTGAQVWSKPLQESYVTELAEGSPVVVGDKVIGVGHGGSSGAARNSIYCFNRFDGSLVWVDGTVYNTIRPFPFSPDNSQVIFPAGIAGISTDGLYSFDINTGKFLWHNSAMVVSARQMKFYQDNQITLIAHSVIGTFNLTAKKLENIIADTIHRATVLKDRIFYTKNGYGADVECRSLYNNTPIWRTSSPYGQVWDTTSNISSSHTSSLVADEDYLYYAEYIFNGPHPSPVNSLFIFRSSNGEVVKEIKLKTTDTPFSTTFFLVKDGKAYYTDMR